jgi:glucan biosynthesis protein C
VVIEAQRIPALDAYRATMMLLGLVLHSAVFTATYAPIRTNLGEDLLYLIYDFIHTFRMPAFIFVSGFFSALIFTKYGARALIGNRAKRILLPLLIFWPLVTIAFQLVFALATGGSVVPAEQNFVEFYHLWFLAYLVYLNSIAVLLVKMLPWVFTRPLKILNYRIGQVALYVIATLLLAVIPYTLEPDGTLKTASAVAPDNSMIAFYLIIFLLGWLAFQNQSIITNFRKHWYLFLIIGSIGYLAHLATSEQLDFDYRVVYFGASLNLSFAILGLMQKLITKTNSVASYFSQGSYWIYIVHLPIVLLILTLLEDFEFGMGTRFSLVLTLTTLLSLASYQLLVRHKPIGRFLGKKPN